MRSCRRASPPPPWLTGTPSARTRPVRPCRNPCDELKFYVGYMDVDTDFPGCNKTWLETAGFQPKM